LEWLAYVTINSDAPARKDFDITINSDAPARKDFDITINSDAPAQKDFNTTINSDAWLKEVLWLEISEHTTINSFIQWFVVLFDGLKP
jgi:hypothetical protein